MSPERGDREECSRCGEPHREESQEKVFAMIIDEDEDREVFAGSICTPCAIRLAGEFRGASGGLTKRKRKLN